MTVLQNAGLILLATSFAAAGCFNGGRTGDAQVVRDNIASVCNVLKGSYTKGLSRDACVKDVSNQWYFVIKNQGSKVVTIDFETCKKNLLLEVNGCDKHGGEQKIGDMYYK
jgi:hypothetical protein